MRQRLFGEVNSSCYYGGEQPPRHAHFASTVSAQRVNFDVFARREKVTVGEFAVMFGRVAVWLPDADAGVRRIGAILRLWRRVYAGDASAPSGLAITGRSR